MSKRMKKILGTTEMWFWRRMLKVPWIDKISKNIIKQVNEKEDNFIVKKETIKIHQTEKDKRRC
jgi:hypothetical protein